MSNEKAEFDSPWKDILDIYFEQFMAYCWSERHAEIDWQRGYKSLDKELSKITRDSANGHRIADKLMQIYLKNGQEAYILLHIEIQGSKDSALEERMFIYWYRLSDRYKVPIASIAILIDKYENWRPGTFRQELWGSYVEMGFPIIKILDYKNKIEELEQSSNPFATVILIQLAAIEKQPPEDKLNHKLKLIRGLYKRGWGQEKIRPLLIFLEWIIALPPQFEVKYIEGLERIEEEMHMKYVPTWERRGIAKGIEEGERFSLEYLLQNKFKIIPEQYKQKIQEAKTPALLNWLVRAANSQSIEEVFETKD